MPARCVWLKGRQDRIEGLGSASCTKLHTLYPAQPLAARTALRGGQLLPDAHLIDVCEPLRQVDDLDLIAVFVAPLGRLGLRPLDLVARIW